MASGIQPLRPPVTSGDPTTRQVRTAIQTLDTPGIRKITVKAVVLGVATVNVPHQLRKAPIGWQITDQNAQADVWRDPAGVVTNDTIPLKASATVTVDLVFW